jgi:hypothetical protein
VGARPRRCSPARGLMAALGAVNVLTCLDALGLFDFVGLVARNDSPSIWLLILAVGVVIAVTLERRPIAGFLDRCSAGISGREPWTHLVGAFYVALTAGAVYVVALISSRD